MASLIPQLAAGLPDLYRPALPIQPETPVTRAQRLAAALQQAQRDAGNPDAPYPVELPSFSQYAFGTPGAFDDVRLPPVSFGGDPDKMGRVRQAGGILTDNALRSAVTGHNPDAPDWVNAGADAANTGSLTGMPLIGAIRAFHGSPHDFDAFDMSKIGTGEGAQAYGHGLYFAENPEVALSYKKSLGGGRMEVTPAGGSRTTLDYDQWHDTLPEILQGIDPKIIGQVAAGKIKNAVVDAAHGGMSPLEAFDAAAAKTYARLQKNGQPDHVIAFEKQSDARTRAALEKLDPKNVNVGKQYEVSIDAHPDEFLDWDKPLSEQSPQVQKALKGAWLAHPDAHAKQTGAQIYQIAAQDRAGKKMIGQGDKQWGPVDYPDEAAATEALRAAGIKGIRYADQGSRKLPSTPATDIAQEWLRDAGGDIGRALAAYDRHLNDSVPAHLRDPSMAEIRDAISKGGKPPQQTHNYVVFDDKTIAILKKYGIAGLTAGGAAVAVARSGIPSEKTQEQSDTGRQLPVAVLGVRG